MSIKALIKQKRQQLGESEEIFGKRFGVDEITVKQWGEGEKETLYQVIEFVLPDDEEVMEKSGKLLGILHQTAIECSKEKNV